MADEIRLRRNLAAEKVKASNKKLGNSTTADKPREAARHHKDLTEHYDNFESLHIQLALKLKITLEDPQLKADYMEISMVVDTAELTYQTYNENKEMRESVRQKEHAANEKKRHQEEEHKKIRTRINTEFQEVMQQVENYVEMTEEAHTNKTVLSRELDYLSDRLNKSLKLCDEYMRNTTCDSEYATIADTRNKAERSFRAQAFKIRSFTDTDRGGSRPGTPSVSNSRSSSPTPNRDSFKYKKMEFPRFSGIIRQYRTFKRDFKDVVQDPGAYDEKHMSHILRHECLTGDAKTLVHNIHDFRKLWEKLDEKYDDESEVVEIVSKQIYNLRKVEEEDYDGLVKLIDIVEKANLDLTAMGSTAVLNNPMTVRMILQKCPKVVKEGLANELASKKPEEEFDALLSFLIKKRKEATRLARLKEEKPVYREKQGFKKGATNVAEGRDDDRTKKRPEKRDKKEDKGFACVVAGCNYKQRHFLSACRTFKKLQVNDKGKIVLDQKLCVLCFSPHDVASCPKKTEGWKECDVNNCGKWHSRLLHGAVVPGLVLFTKDVTAEPGGTKTLLLIQGIDTPTDVCTTLWDTGSTISLVSNKYAEETGLKGSDCCFELSGVGGNKQTYSTKLYMVPLNDKEGRQVQIHAFGIDKITADLTKMDLQGAAEAFDIEEKNLPRPDGPVNLLIGMNYADLIPNKLSVNKKLVLYTSNFGTGYVVGGSLGATEDDIEQIDSFAYTVCHSAGSVKPVDFLSAEAFGIDVPRRCRHCKGCKECGFRASALTWTEARELAEIEKGLSLDTTKKVWTATYPFQEDPTVLKNNHPQAMACMASLEKRLKKEGQIPAFNEQFNDAIERGVFQELSKEDQDEYNGPVNYVTITEAYKDGEHTTTPLRLCMNSSMRYQGRSLNDCLMKGPSALNNIYSVLLNFRSYPVAFVKDLSKFYQSVLASERDQHLRRVLWRQGDDDKPPKIYKTRTVNFGDKPAGCIALTAVRNTADLYQNMDPGAAEKLKRDNYVDDVASGDNDKESALATSANMDRIVQMGGFTFKSTIMSGDVGEPRRVLGTGWNTEQDTLFIEVKVNTCPKRKGIRTGPNIAFEDINTSFPEKLTKRIIWRVVLGQFDLLGLASIFFIRLKFLMRDLSGETGRKIGWDDALSEDLRKRFMGVLELMGGIKNLQFPRCITPAGAKENADPELLVFGDGSKQAFCSLAYIRWELEDGSYKCFLVSGKTRVAPLKKISVPRLELLGSVACVRLASSIQEGLHINISRRYFFTDSSAVFGMIKGECGAFTEFIGTRTGEIKNKSDPEKEWFWLPTQENLADLGTRDDVTPELLSPDSEYLNGKKWMREDFKHWPVNQKPGGTIPEEEMCPAARSTLVTTVTKPFIALDRFSSFNKVTRVMAYVFLGVDRFIAGKSKISARKPEHRYKHSLETKYIEKAEDFLMFKAQSKIRKDFQDGKLSSLKPKLVPIQNEFMQGQLVVTSGRLGGAMAIGYDKEYLPVLEYDSQISRLIMIDAHRIDHSGVDRTLQRSRSSAWIIKGRRMAKTVSGSCTKCKIRNKMHESQIMAPLPESRIAPAPVFHSTAVDLFGPLDIRDTVKRRTSRKCWGVLFCCTATSAVHIEVTEDYSCDSFLLCLKRFINLRGVPARIQSDPGSQLLAAASEFGKWDFSKITEWATGVKTEWHKIPTDSQHFNGCAEAMIKCTKKQLSNQLKEKTFTKGELDTLFSNICFIINSRPLMKRAGEDPLSGGPITPLHLIGGRSTMRIPTVNLDGTASLTKRLKFLEETTEEFWKKWFVQVFHNLVPSYKWKTEKRNVQAGDIVLLKESNQLRGEYKLAKVTEAIPGRDGKVRRVKIGYKNLQPTGHNMKNAVDDLKKTKFSETERCVQNIVVIVPVDVSQEEMDIAVTQGIGL